jgi:hypothetical protein
MNLYSKRYTNLGARKAPPQPPPYRIGGQYAVLFEAIMNETAHPRRTGGSIGAVLTGLVVDILVTTGTDIACCMGRSGASRAAM